MEAFAQHYSSWADVRTAANRAGITTQYPRTLLERPQVVQRIDYLRAEVAKRAKVTRERVIEAIAARALYRLDRLVKTDENGNIVPKSPEELDRLDQLAIDLSFGPNGAKAKLADRDAALDKLARIFGLYDQTIRLEAGDSLENLMERIHNNGSTPITITQE